MSQRLREARWFVPRRGGDSEPAFREHSANWFTQSYSKEMRVQKMQDEQSPLFLLFLFLVSPHPPPILSLFFLKQSHAML